LESCEQARLADAVGKSRTLRGWKGKVSARRDEALNPEGKLSALWERRKRIPQEG